jgi:hypothetical protein
MRIRSPLAVLSLVLGAAPLAAAAVPPPVQVTTSLDVPSAAVIADAPADAGSTVGQPESATCIEIGVQRESSCVASGRVVLDAPHPEYESPVTPESIQPADESANPLHERTMRRGNASASPRRSLQHAIERGRLQVPVVPLLDTTARSHTSVPLRS